MTDSLTPVPASQTRALDLATFVWCIDELNRRFLGETTNWFSNGSREQDAFLQWCSKHRDLVAKLHHIEALASEDGAKLNKFLASHGFAAMFPEQLNGIGAAAILDLLLMWREAGTDATVRRQNVAYPAFKLGIDNGLVAYEHSTHGTVYQIETDNGSFWLTPAGAGRDPIDLFLMATEISANPGKRIRNAGKIIVPCLDVDVTADVNWLKGMKTSNEWIVDEAFQIVKVRANKHGARAKVASGMVARGISFDPTYVFGEPFTCWFTQPDSVVPLAVVFADVDSWKDGGSLESL